MHPKANSPPLPTADELKGEIQKTDSSNIIIDTENGELSVHEITPAVKNSPVDNVVDSRSTEEAEAIDVLQTENVEEKPKRKKKKVRSKKSTTKETTEQPSLELRGQVDCEPVVPEPVKDGDAQIKPKEISPPISTPNELTGETQKTDSTDVINIENETTKEAEPSSKRKKKKVRSKKSKKEEESLVSIVPTPINDEPILSTEEHVISPERQPIECEDQLKHISGQADPKCQENDEERPKRKKKKVRSKKSTTKETTEQPSLEFRGQVDCEPVAPEPVKDGDTQIKHKEISSSIPTPDELSGETQNTDPSDIINIENETTKEAEPGSKRKKKKVRSRKSRKDEESLFPIVPTPINDEPILSTEEHVISPEKQPVECEDQLEHISGQTNPESQNNVEEKPKRKKKKVRSKKSNTKEMTDQTQLEFRGQVDCEPILSTEEHVILSEKQPIECEDQLEHISGQTDPKR